VKITTMAGAAALVLAGALCAGAQSAFDPASPLFGPPSKDEVFIQLVDTLGEPRHYCVDFPGFPASGVLSEYRESTWPLGVHTCKINIPHANIATMDQMFSMSALACKHIRFSRLQVCADVVTYRGLLVPGHVEENLIRQDAQITGAACSDAPGQDFVLDAQGRIKPLMDQTKCLTVGQEAFEAGDRTPGVPWHRRDLDLSKCTAEASKRQTWRTMPAQRVLASPEPHS